MTDKRRKSKLTDRQWTEIEARMLDGEAGCALAKEFGLTYNAIKKRLGATVHQTKRVANQIIATEDALASLPVGAQINAVNLAAKIRSTNEHLVGAAHYGAMTAHQLSRLANAEANKIGDQIDEDSIEVVKSIAALTRTANEAGTIGMALIKATKDDSPRDQLKTLSDAELESIATGRA